MAKSRKPKKQGAKPIAAGDSALPRNIQLVGEGDVEEGKSIYIAQPVYRAIHKFAAGKTTVESGGMLVGGVIQEFGKANIIINGFVEARFCEATASTLKFTHETWAQCHKDIARKYPGQKIVGWIHTHPDFGIFLSEYDKFIQENFFKEEDQIAYVVDPVQGAEGFYVWKNGKIERSKGFFIFDKTGAHIDSGAGEPRPAAGGRGKGLLAACGAAALLVIAFIAIAMYASNLGVKLERLQQQQQTIVEGANQSLNYMQMQITALEEEVAGLKAQAAAQTQESPEQSPGDIQSRLKALEEEIARLKAEALPQSEPE
jgi:proteasome lid subunit RPN8/RPN11/uncharacterized small protein (DUF1192 family)